MNTAVYFENMADAAYFKNMADAANSSNQQVSSILPQIESGIESSATKGNYEVKCLVQAKQSQVFAVIAQLEARGFSVYDRYQLGNGWAFTIKW
jgi:hypothetical protein